jgi:dienelactone hydrolase
VITEIIHYQLDGIDFKGYLARPDSPSKKLPAVLIAHTWHGQDHFVRKKAEELAKLGYVGFALDLYGNGVNAKDNEEALQLMLPLFLDRKLLRSRVNAGFDVLKGQSFVDQEAIGAIGFCFGGLTVIELLRSGAGVKGVVSFHGLLGSVLDKYTATLAPNSEKIQGSLLILHGYKDPLVSQCDIQAIQEEMTKANVEWQMNIYGQAAHAFTNPQAKDAASGMVYNKQVADRAWLAMTNFFNERFRS